MKLLNFKNKKGQAENYFAVIVALFAFGFIAILAYVIQFQMNSEFASANVLPPGTDQPEKYLGAIALHDYIIVLLMVVFIVLIGITSYRISTIPVFFVVTFIMSAFYGFVSYFFNYLFSQMVSESVFNTAIVHFPKTLIICTNFHWIMLANIIIGSITLYAKKSRGQFE